uniref:Uncharacterized protein n=1 Tax=Nelumbo nucifera TaxID=4432 RepID=A0A822Z1P9_NELNU|nr:TPA_asm: hypothetical protein HUJ06_014667 [Nelumbo nucifera]
MMQKEKRKKERKKKKKKKKKKKSYIERLIWKCTNINSDLQRTFQKLLLLEQGQFGNYKKWRWKEKRRRRMEKGKSKSMSKKKKKNTITRFPEPLLLQQITQSPAAPAQLLSLPFSSSSFCLSLLLVRGWL